MAQQFFPRNYTVNRILGLIYNQEFAAAIEETYQFSPKPKEHECAVLKAHIEWLIPGIRKKKLPRATWIISRLREETAFNEIKGALTQDINADDPELRRSIEAIALAIEPVIGHDSTIRIIHQSLDLYDPIYIVHKFIGMSAFVSILLSIPIAKLQINEIQGRAVGSKNWSVVRPMDLIDMRPILKNDPPRFFNIIRPFIVFSGILFFALLIILKIYICMQRWLNRPSSYKLLR